MHTLTVVITTYNNQDLITDCLKSVDFANEVIVVDNGSSDTTREIAAKAGVKVLHHQNQPTKLNQAKNFGFEHASSEWILSLDSDERVDADLKKQIQELLKQENISCQGFKIPRKNIIFGKWIRHGLWYPDHQVRLFEKGKGKFPVIHQHEYIKVQGILGELAGHITHLNYQTVSQYLQKIDRLYSDNEAEIFVKKGQQLHWYDAIRFPGQDFLSNYFAREAYKDGLHGLVLSMLQAFYMFIVFCKIWEIQGFTEQSIKLRDTQFEFKRFEKQLRYWFIFREMQTAGITKKIILKLKSWL